MSKSDDRVFIWAALSTSLLVFLQDLDGAEIAGFTAMEGFLEDFGNILQTVATSLGGLNPPAVCWMGQVLPWHKLHEVSPKDLRGVLLASFGLFVGLDSFVGTCVNQGTYQLQSRWCYRILVLTQLICPVIFLLVSWLLPNSPRFLVGRGRIERYPRPTTPIVDFMANHPN
jgi:hypothetical protein